MLGTELDLADGQSFRQGFPHEFFARLRQEAPVAWHPRTAHTPDNEGFWVVSSYDACATVLRDPGTYSSASGGNRSGGGTGMKDERNAGVMLNMTDDPRHRRLRRLLSAGFTPKALARLGAELDRRAGKLLRALPEGEPFEAMAHLATPLPLWAICELLGIPAADRPSLLQAVDEGLDSEATEIMSRKARNVLKSYAIDLIQAKRKQPDESIFSTIVHASDPDGGGQLSERELIAFFGLLFPAGAETTRSALGGALLAFAEQPERLQQLDASEEGVRGAVEEIVRWTTPSIYKRRTVTRSTRLGGQQLEPGAKVTVWEASANRDAEVFERPFEFDPKRWPNRHLGFGAGVHFCLGASLARLELRAMVRALKQHDATFELCAPPRYPANNRLLGLKSLSLRQALRR